MKKHIRQRQEFIKKKLDKDGFINRADIVAQFEVSDMTAANDLRDFRSLWPNYIKYDYQEKKWKKDVAIV